MATLPTGGFARSSIVAQPGLVDPRLLALDPSAVLAAAGQGLRLVDMYGNLQDTAVARGEQDAIRGGRINAANARNRLVTDQAGADLALLPAETTARTARLALDTNRDQGALTLEPTRQALAGDKLRLDQGDVTFRLDTQPDVQTLERRSNELALADQDLKRADQGLKRGEQAIQQLKNSADLAVQEETNKFLAANPQATAQQLEAGLLQNKRVLDTAKAYNDFVAKNPGFEQAGLETQKATLAAQRAVADATVRSGGVAPNQGVVNPNREFQTRSARNLADADKILQFGDLNRVQSFQATPEGQAIIAAILSAPPNLPVRLTPQQRASIDSYRAQRAAPAPAPAPAPQAVPGAVPPQAQAVPITPPQSAVAFLRANPSQAAAFEQKYGVSAATYLGQ
jgi:hypothetical protein